MSCPKTEHILQEYFADDLAPVASVEIEKHLAQCTECEAELNSMLQAREALLQWREAKVPHWDRGMELFRREHRVSQPGSGWFNIWQWLPTGASLAMLLLLLFNTTVTANGDGVALSFGASPGDASPGATLSGDPQVMATLTEFQQQQRQEIQEIIAGFEERQDSNNIQLLQAVMAQTQQTTADNLDRIYAYFEEQRLQDMEAMRLGYQQLADSDYATIQSLQDLVQYVSFQEPSR